MRLTKTDRDAIRLKILDHAYGQRVDEQVDAELQLIEEIYNSVYEKDLPIVKQLNSDWFDTVATMRVSFAGTFQNLNFSIGARDDWHNWPFLVRNRPTVVMKAVPYKTRHYAQATYDYDHPFAIRFEELKDKAQVLIGEIRKRSKEIATVLDAHTTAEKLVKTWPEIETFVKPYMGAAPTTHLPVQLDSMNSALGLPPETKAA